MSKLSPECYDCDEQLMQNCPGFGGQPSTSVGDLFTMSGDCQVQANCVSSRNYPDEHTNNEYCEVTIMSDVAVIPGNVFSVETCCDTLMIDGRDVESVNSVPDVLTPGDRFTWTSDSSVTRSGWQLCFEPTIVTTSNINY